MSTVFVLLCVQIVLGALDNLWHHEITERLHARRSARDELALHTARELLYGVLFLALAWFEWHGAWAIALGAILIAELVITLADFLVEDRTRRLPPLERALHTVLAVNAGALLGAIAPVLLDWGAAPAAIHATGYGAWSWWLTVAGIGVTACGVRDLIAVARLSGPMGWQRHPLRIGRRRDPRLVLVTGATGLVGHRLVRALLAGGDQVIVLTRDRERAFERFGPHVRIVTDLDTIDAATPVDAVVNLAGAPVADQPWTAARRRTLVNSRLGTTRALVRLAARLAQPPAVLVSASAVGYYGVHANAPLTEASASGTGFQSRLCVRWERSARVAERLGVRVVTLRLALVLDRDGGFLPRVLAPMRVRLAAVLGDGHQWQPWIHAADAVRLVVHALDDTALRGPVNAVAPGAARHRELVRTAARIRRCIAVSRIPAAVLRTTLGELAELLVDGQLVLPAAALGSGFRFEFGNVDAALADLLGERAAPSGLLEVSQAPRARARRHGRVHRRSRLHPLRGGARRRRRPMAGWRRPGPRPVIDRLVEHGWSVMLYDGDCVFCSRAVRFVAGRSPRSLLAFSAIQSRPARALLERLGQARDAPHTLLVIEAGQVLERSAAVLRLMELMRGPWPLLARVARAIPGAVRDALYDRVAANRYRILGRNRRCMLTDPALARRYVA